MFPDIENTCQKPALNGMLGTSLGEKLSKFIPQLLEKLTFFIQIRPQTPTTLIWRTLPLSTVQGSGDEDGFGDVGTNRITLDTSATRRWTT